LNDTIAETAASRNDSMAVPGVDALNETQREFRKESNPNAEFQTRNPKNKSRRKAGKAANSEAGSASKSQGALGVVGARIQRATTLARDVEGDVVHRVQKVREISSVVLDEAGYDPSLRFVLVAAVVFLVFLIIVLLNKFIG
jgi:cobalamin biosynthesis Mg chelatase CobN